MNSKLLTYSVMPLFATLLVAKVVAILTPNTSTKPVIDFNAKEESQEMLVDIDQQDFFLLQKQKGLFKISERKDLIIFTTFKKNYTIVLTILVPPPRMNCQYFTA